VSVVPGAGGAPGHGGAFDRLPTKALSAGRRDVGDRPGLPPAIGPRSSSLSCGFRPIRPENRIQFGEESLIKKGFFAEVVSGITK
jgi:hypothetical protein